jgi:hypothetical protein
MKTELWMIDYDGRLVCPRDDCAGPEAGEAIREGGVDALYVGGNRYVRFNETDIAELGPLLAGTGHFILQCEGGHVSFDMRTRRLEVMA